ncbi:MAG: hypothetical protein Q4A66_13735 [Eubacteriales bacterium]|nr:hypothetical protein [Eubacteriales bacterium]
MRQNQFCRDCAKYAACTRRMDERQTAECPFLKEEEEPLRYRNSEGYPDPTAYFALRNAMRKPKQEKKDKSRRPRTQVVHYD